jgi:uncharacterized membrane protein (TIGR02234 family)
VTGTRGRAVAVVACLAGAGLVLLASSRAWAELPASGGGLVPSGPAPLTGRDLVPLAYACGLAALAGTLALLATRGWPRRVVGVLLVVLGGAALLSGLTGAGAQAVRDAAGTAAEAPVTRTAWPWVSHAGAVLVVAAGVLTAAVGHRWAGMSDRYDAPAAREQGRAARRPADAGDLWSALDRGEDPTTGPASEPAAGTDTAGTDTAGTDATGGTTRGTGGGPTGSPPRG